MLLFCWEEIIVNFRAFQSERGIYFSVYNLVVMTGLELSILLSKLIIFKRFVELETCVRDLKFVLKLYVAENRVKMTGVATVYGSQSKFLTCAKKVVQ